MNNKLVTHLLDHFPVQGIDISRWNDRSETDFVLDPTLLIRGGYRFAFVRFSQGLWKDTRFDVFWKLLKEKTVEISGRICRIDRGAYIFPDWYNYNRSGGPSEDYRTGIAQAKFFREGTKADPGELPPMVDLETNTAWFTINSSTYAPVMRVTYALINELAQLCGCLPILYGGQAVYPFLGSALKNYDNFIAWYNDAMTSKKNIDAICTKFGLVRGWKFLQHASDGDADNNGTADGEALGLDSDFADLDVFNGTEEQYSIYSGSAPAPSGTTTEDETTPAPQEETTAKTKTVLVKTTTGYLNLRSSPAAGTSKTILKVLSPGIEVECIEKIIDGSDIWWRVGQGQYVAERFNGNVFLK